MLYNNVQILTHLENLCWIFSPCAWTQLSTKQGSSTLKANNFKHHIVNEVFLTLTPSEHGHRHQINVFSNSLSWSVFLSIFIVNYYSLWVALFLVFGLLWLEYRSPDAYPHYSNTSLAFPFSIHMVCHIASYCRAKGESGTVKLSAVAHLPTPETLCYHLLSDKE